MVPFSHDWADAPALHATASIIVSVTVNGSDVRSYSHKGFAASTNAHRPCGDDEGSGSSRSTSTMVDSREQRPLATP
jgi:hypothetical protein